MHSCGGRVRGRRSQYNQPMGRSAVSSELLTRRLDTLTHGGEALGRHTGPATGVFPHTDHLETTVLWRPSKRAIL